jgi:hypothetical protein
MGLIEHVLFPQLMPLVGGGTQLVSHKALLVRCCCRVLLTPALRCVGCLQLVPVYAVMPDPDDAGAQLHQVPCIPEGSHCLVCRSAGDG